MKKKLFLHIGTTKTGTTSIQRAFAAQSFSDVLYPRAGRSQHGHHNLAYQLGETCGSLQPYDPARGGWEELVQEARASAASRIVVSSEALSFLPAESLLTLPPLLNAFDVEILMYVRRQDLWLHSQYLQYAKFGRVALDAEAFLASDWNPRRRAVGAHSPLQIYEAWASAFGGERIRPYLYQSRSIGDDVVSHILAHIGVLEAEHAAHLPVANARPRLKAVVAIGMLRRTLAENGGLDDGVGVRLAGAVSAFFKGRPDFVDRYQLFCIDQARSVLAQCAADTEAFLALLPAPDQFDPVGPGDYPNPVLNPASYEARFDDEERRRIAVWRDVVKRSR